MDDDPEFEAMADLMTANPVGTRVVLFVLIAMFGLLNAVYWLFALPAMTSAHSDGLLLLAVIGSVLLLAFDLGVVLAANLLVERLRRYRDELLRKEVDEMVFGPEERNPVGRGPAPKTKRKKA